MDKFHIFQFPDGREVYEISLANAELYFPSYLSDSIPGMEPNKAVIQNIMFVENKENGRFDPVIARYYPNNENSIREFGEIYYNMIDLGWSGTIDIWTYDERHFIGFNILEGELVSTVRYDTGIEENAKVISGHNFLTVDCFRVPTYLSYTYTTTGYYETTVVATQNYETICSNGGSAAPGYGNDSGVTYPYLGPSDGGGSGGYGSVGEPTYIPPAIASPGLIIINQLTNPCARGIYTQLKDGGLISALSVSGHEFPQIIIDLLEKAEKYNFVIMNSDLGLSNGSTTTRMFNQGTGKYDIWIQIDNEYLERASKISIARTIIHESIHAYLLHEQYINPLGDLYSGLARYSIKVGITDPNKLHHEFMPQFIDAIALSLWSWDVANASNGQIPLSYMKDLAWGGLTSYKDENGTVRNYDSFKERFPNSSDRNRIEGIIKNESDGNNAAKSQKCP